MLIDSRQMGKTKTRREARRRIRVSFYICSLFQWHCANGKSRLYFDFFRGHLKIFLRFRCQYRACMSVQCIEKRTWMKKRIDAKQLDVNVKGTITPSSAFTSASDTPSIWLREGKMLSGKKKRDYRKLFFVACSNKESKTRTKPSQETERNNSRTHQIETLNLK